MHFSRRATSLDMGQKTPGFDAVSNLGGKGWIPRAESHASEVSEGRRWLCCGCSSEIMPLRSVLIASPPASLATIERPEDYLMVERVDLARMRAQARAVAATYRRNGVDVTMVRPPPYAPPNIIFLRDLFFMTPAGAVLARMASEQRAGEERHAAEALARAGIPIVGTVTGTGTFEGGDALWLDRNTVVIGVGFRTNKHGADTVAGVLRDQGVAAVQVPLEPGVQHLLGTAVLLDHGVAAIHRAAVHPELRALLRDREYHCIELEPDAELLAGRAMNVVALSPGKVLMPAGSPGIRRRFEEAGIEGEQVEVGEYLKAAGGPGCMTGIVRRES